MLTVRIFWKTGQTAILIVLLVMLAALLGRSGPVALAQTTPSLLFMENVGQFAATARFQTYDAWGTLSLAEDALWFSLVKPTNSAARADTAAGPNSGESQQGVHLKFSFVGANPQPELQPFDPSNIPVSYFSVNDSAGRHPEVPVWGGVRYVDLYPGIDLEISGKNGQLVQRLVVRDVTGEVSASDVERLSNIQLQVEGAETLELVDGQLRLNTAVGEFTLPLLQVEPADAPLVTNLSPTVEANLVTQPFTFAPVVYDAPLQIAGAADLVYSTFLGGSGGGETGHAIAVDPAGNAYVAGNTYSPDFPTTPGAFNTSHEFQNGFVVKLNAGGSNLLYATFLEQAQAFGIAVDNAGSAYVTGDDTILKLNATGTALLYATSIEGTGMAIAVDESGNAYATGRTSSTTFTTTPDAFQPDFQGAGHDAFVIKLNATGEVAYATYLGGSGDDSGRAIAVDSAGSAYVTGYTESANFPNTPGAFRTNQDTIFVVKLNPAGSALDYGTFLGGNGYDASYGLAVDQAGNAYVVGDTTSNNFPTTPGAFQTTYHSGIKVTYEGDAFVVKLNPTGTGLVYGTYLGGSDHDNSWGVAVDQAGNAYVSGSAYSPDFPTTPDSFQPTRSGYPDVFVAKLNAAGSDLLYGTYLGGDHGEAGYALAVDQVGNAYVTGHTTSPNFPITAGAFDTSLSGGTDVFVSKLFTGETPLEPEPTPTPPIPAYDCAPTTLGTVTVGDTPRGIALDVGQERAYVANYGSGSISVIDTGTNTVLNTIANIPSANGITYDGLHNMIWVTNTDNNQVTPIQVNDTATTFTVLAPVSVGDGPWGVVFDPIYGHLYVANSLGNSVSVIDVAQQTVVATLDQNFNQPYHLAANPINGKVYAANFGNHTVTVLKGTGIEKVVNLWDSTQPYGITVDETRSVVYVSTVDTNRIVAIGTLQGVPDQFLGWSMFFRGQNRHRPLPLRVISINPEAGPAYDGGHLWTTTATADGSELDQALLIPKGWSSYFHVPLPQNVPANPTDGIAVDRTHDRVYISSGVSPGVVTVMGDHDSQCATVAPAAAGETAGFNFDVFSREALFQGDANNDGVIDIFDLAFIAGRYNNADYRADVNDDGLVDIFDLAFTANRYGQKTK